MGVKEFDFSLFKGMLKENVAFDVQERQINGTTSLKIISTPSSFVFVRFFLTDVGEVSIELDFSLMATAEFKAHIEMTVNKVVEEMRTR